MKAKYTLSLLFAAICAISAVAQKPDHTNEDPAEFNKKIAGKQMTPEELVLAYYNGYDPKENSKEPEIILTETLDGSEPLVITLIHDSLPDDSGMAERVIMTASESEKGTWTVQEIKRSHKCWPDRGESTRWHAELCK